MKKTIILSISMIFLVLNCFGQTKAPDKIKAVFGKMFPKATQIKWEKEKNEEYEASFVQDGIKKSASFNVEGTWLESEEEIAISKVPSKVSDGFYNKFGKNQKILGASKIENNKGETCYEFDYKLGGKAKEVIFDLEGNPK